LAQEIIETELVLEHHWLPQEISKIPYKKLQMLFIIQNQQCAAKESRANIDKFRSQHSSKNKRFVREV
jgi:hypothetical protein